MVEEFVMGALSGRAKARPVWFLPGLLAAWLLGSALALGSAPYWIAVAVLGSVAVSSVLVLGEIRRGWSVLSTLLLGLALVSALQLVPVPLALLSRISPTVASYWLDTGRIPSLPAGLPRYGSLSLDPGATTLEVLKWSVYAIVSAAAGRLSKISGLSATMSIIGTVGTLLSIVGLGHVLMSAERVFGFYAPITARTVIGPLVNPNHFAAYANLAALSCAGLALSASRRKVRLLSGWAVAVNVLACFVSASRGGVVSLLVGLGALLVWSALTRHKEETPRRVVPLLVVYAVLIALGGFSLTSARSRELLDGDWSKLDLLPRAFEAAQDAWLFGLGRGAFDSVAFRYFPDFGPVVLRSIEAFPLSFLVEWGTPVTAIALLTLGRLWWPARVRAGANVRRTSAWIAICAVLVQNLADIGLELPSLSLAFWGLWGAIEATRERGAGVSRKPYQTRASISALGLAALAALLALALGPNAFERRRELHARYLSRDPGFVALARSSMLACPGDPYFPFLAGVDAMSRGDDGLVFGALSLRRAPAFGRGHFLVGRALLARGAREQAILEFRLAMQSDRSLIVDGVRAGLVAAKDEEQIERLVPTGPNRPSVVFELYRHLPEREHPLLRRRLLREACALAPDHLPFLTALLFEQATDVERGTEPCSASTHGRCPLGAPDGLRAELQRGLARLAELDSRSCAPFRIRARLLEMDGRGSDAAQLLGRECAVCSEPGACVRDQLALADRLGEAGLIAGAEQAFRLLSCDSNETCARSEEYLAERARVRGDTATAAQHRFKAASQSPSGERWLKAARAYLNARSFGRAAAAYDRALALGVTDAGVEKELSSLRRDSLRDLLQKDRSEAP